MSRLRASAGDQLRRNAIASISSGSFANEGDTRVMGPLAGESVANRWNGGGMIDATDGFSAERPPTGDRLNTTVRRAPRRETDE